jgi:hypothetical protein
VSKVLQYNDRVAIGTAGGMPVYASFDFLRYLESQRDRSGGDKALTNIELEQSALSSAFNVFSRGSPRASDKKVEQGAYMVVSRGIDRFTVALDIEALKAALLPFLPRQITNKPRPDEAGSILANRIFGAR